MVTGIHSVSLIPASDEFIQISWTIYDWERHSDAIERNVERSVATFHGGDEICLRHVVVKR
jgi:hypothetical protein